MSQKKKRKRQKWAFLVGIGKYEKDSFSELPYVEDNIEELHKILTEVNDFNKKNIIILTSKKEPKPRRNNISKAFRRFIRKTKPKDFVLIYFLGHGCSYKGQNYFHTYNSYIESTDLGTIKESSLPLKWFDEYISENDFDTRDIIMIVDACREKSIPTLGDTSQEPYIRSDPTGLSKFFSCSPKQYAHSFTPEKSLQSIFTYSLLKGLKEDLPKPIKFGTIVDYLIQEVEQNAYYELKAQQKPCLITSKDSLREKIRDLIILDKEDHIPLEVLNQKDISLNNEIAQKPEEKTFDPPTKKSIEKRKDEKKIQKLIMALKDEDAEVRHEAARALGKIRGKAEQAVPALIEALKDEYKYVRYEAALVLGDMGGKAEEVVPALIEALKDEDYLMRYWSTWALGTIGEKGGKAEEVVPALIEALQDERMLVRIGAAWALAMIGGKAEQAVPALIEALKDEEKDMRSSAMKALGGIGKKAEKAIPALRDVAQKDQDRIMREAATIALEKIRGKQ